MIHLHARVNAGLTGPLERAKGGTGSVTPFGPGGAAAFAPEPASFPAGAAFIRAIISSITSSDST